MSGEDGRRLAPRPGRPIAATFCALAVGIFFFATLRDGHVWGDDFSLYISHARNIASGAPYGETGYIYNPQNSVLGPRLYPPGFPVVLAPVAGTFGLDLRPMKILVLAFFVGSLLVMIPLFRQVLPASSLAILVLIVGLNPFFWDFKDYILSDVPFLFLVLASLLFFTRAAAAAGAGADAARRRMLFLVLAGGAAYAAYATRTLAVMLIPCYIAHDLIRHRRITIDAAVAAGIVVALAGLQHLLWLYDDSYFDQGLHPLAAARQNIPAYLQTLADVWENGYSNDVRRLAFLGASALGAAGYVTSWRTGVSVLHLFPPLYLAPVIVWPSYQGMRFLIPILPFYFCFCLLGVRWLGAVAERRGMARNLVLAVFLGAVAATYAARYSTLQFGPLPEGIARKESRQLFEFVAAATGPQDVLVFSKPRALALMTGRKASGPVNAADPCELWQYMSAIGATYVVTGPDSDVFNEDAAYLRQFVARFDGSLQRVMANADVGVYRIGRNPCPRGTPPP